jgi:hypothetical protein
MGIVFQAYNLIPFLTVAENVALVLTPNGISRREAFRRARALRAEMDLDHRADTHPATLSGGEQQRLAVARAGVRSDLPDDRRADRERASSPGSRHGVTGSPAAEPAPMFQRETPAARVLLGLLRGRGRGAAVGLRRGRDVRSARGGFC